MKKIVYVMDPLCGWCYGNSNNITSLYNKYKEQINFELVVGGMWLYNNAPMGGAGLHQFVKNHTPKMAALTNAEVGAQYFTLAADTTYTFSSLEPCAAIYLIKKQSPEKVFSFAKEVQKKMFVTGEKLNELQSYLPVLKDLAINTTDFTEKWLSETNVLNTKKEFARATALANGFPTLIYQEDNQTTVLAAGYFEKNSIENKIIALIK